MHLPIHVNFEDKQCLVVGGGKIGLKRCQKLLDFGAKVTVISPELKEKFKNIDNKVTFVKREYRKGDLSDFFFVVIATDNSEVNQAVAAEAREAAILYNLADNPDKESVIMPGIVSENGFVASITTGGASPILTKNLLKEIKALITGMDADILKKLSAEREQILASDVKSAKKKKLLKQSVADALNNLKGKNGKKKKH